MVKTLKQLCENILGSEMQPFLKVKKEKDKAFNKIILLIGTIYRDLPVLES
jgi:hypothetical protein